MNKGYTHISVILDRTGSMQEIRDDTIGGFNAFLNEQKAEAGTATLTLVQFDTQDPYEVVCRFKPIQEVPELTRATYLPRASTPLLDAMGRGINDLEAQIGALPGGKRPEKVVVVIVTDGQENSSREFLKEQIVKMIKKHQDQDDWQFVFLSADLDAIGDAHEVGFRDASAMHFAKTAVGTAAVFDSASKRISEYRRGAKRDVSFEEEDRRRHEELIRKKMAEDADDSDQS